MANVLTRHTRFLNVITDNFDQDLFETYQNYITEDSEDDSLTLFGEAKIIEVLFKDFSTTTPDHDTIISMLPKRSKILSNVTSSMIRNAYSQIGFKYYYEPPFDYLQEIFSITMKTISISKSNKDKPSDMLNRIQEGITEHFITRITSDLTRFYSDPTTDKYQTDYLDSPYLRSDWNVTPELREQVTQSLMHSQLMELIDVLKSEIDDPQLNEFLISPLAYTTLLTVHAEYHIPIFAKVFPPSLLKYVGRKLLGKKKNLFQLSFSDHSENIYKDHALETALLLLSQYNELTFEQDVTPFAKVFSHLRPTVNPPSYYHPTEVNARTIVTTATRNDQKQIPMEEDPSFKDPSYEGSSLTSNVEQHSEEESTHKISNTLEISPKLLEAIDLIPIKVFNYLVYTTDIDTSYLRSLIKKRAIEQSIPQTFSEISIVPEYFINSDNSNEYLTQNELSDDSITLNGELIFDREKFVLFRDKLSTTLFVVKLSMTNWHY